ncbi:DEP domain-containing protein 1A-like [Pollicipes pollicipes]|uniref:DEP domain-containing protein 1A-like n=1 Tax=Pollicipes pollicipes TaxID=41117 RepID=UPI00188570E4|nr:DEP domain-containing protein 1A-like [Pollicipes pollicipes]
MRALNAAEVDAVWSRTLLARLETLLEAPVIDIVPVSCVVPAWIRHNTVRVTQRGLVQPLQPGQPALPRWLLLAMKSLANWPQYQLADLPESDYADFQLDVFCVIRDYFAALPFPLVPYDLYDPLVAAFLRAEDADRRLRQRQPTARAPGSVENLLLLMSPTAEASTPRQPVLTPLTALRRGDGGYRDFKEDSLFAPPAPVTPARQSVAQLRSRLMRLGRRRHNMSVSSTQSGGRPLDASCPEPRDCRYSASSLPPAEALSSSATSSFYSPVFSPGLAQAARQRHSGERAAS